MRFVHAGRLGRGASDDACECTLTQMDGVALLPPLLKRSQRRSVMLKRSQRRSVTLGKARVIVPTADDGHPLPRAAGAVRAVWADAAVAARCEEVAVAVGVADRGVVAVIDLPVRIPARLIEH